VISVVLIVHLFRCGMCVCSMLKELISDRLKALKIEIAPSRMRIREQYNDRCTRIFDNHLSMEYIKTNYFYLLDRSLCVQDAGYDIPESVIASGASAWLNTRHSYSIADALANAGAQQHACPSAAMAFVDVAIRPHI